MNNYSLVSLHGKLHVKHGYPFKSEFFSDAGKYIVLTPGNFYEAGGFKRQAGKEKFYFGEIPKEYLHRKDDLVVAMTEQAVGLLGSCAFVPNDDMYLHNQRLGLITTDEEQLDRAFVYYLFQTKSVREQIRFTSTGSKVKHTSPERIYAVKAALPEVEEQKRIAAVLSAIDAKIDCNRRISSELESMVKMLYEYWFVQFDFPDSDGKPYKSSGGKMVYNTLLKRDIPQNWAAAPLSSITPVSNESLNPANFPDRLFKHFSIPVFDVVKTYGVELGQSIGSNKFTVLGTDLLVSKLNPWSNRVVYAMDETDQICSTEFVVWRSSSENLKNFLFLIATSQQFISHCVQSASGTSNSHKRVNPSVMMRFELPYEEKVAAEFGKVINPILKKLIVNQRENQHLSQLRDWLLPMLMNGQVMVV